jgi:hypothetical protein
MPGNAKDNHWKIPPSKSSAAATTPALSRTRPKQSIPEGKPLCNPTSGGDAGGGPLPISKINQEQDEGICSPSKDGPCSFPTVHMISSDSLSSISYPLSTLPLQFQADPEDDDYTREAKEQAAWEAAAVLEAQAASVSRDSSAMEVQHQSGLFPRTLRAERGKYQLKHYWISKPRLYYYLPTATRRIPTNRRAGAHPDFRADQSHRHIGHLRWRESPQWMFRSVSSSTIFARPYFEECNQSS